MRRSSVRRFIMLFRHLEPHFLYLSISLTMAEFPVCLARSRALSSIFIPNDGIYNVVPTFGTSLFILVHKFDYGGIPGLFSKITGT